MSILENEQTRQGYILHSRPYRETSLLLEVFSRDEGRIGLIAKGARTSKKKINSLLQPFQPLCLQWRGKSELPILTSVEQVEPRIKLAGRTLLSAFYLNELLVRLLHRHDPYPGLFHLYEETLHSLQKDEKDVRSLRIFEKGLLDELGYGLLLTNEANTGDPLQPDTLYSYIAEHGPVYTVGTNNQGTLQVRGNSLLSLHNEQLDDEVSLRESKYLLRSVLEAYLGSKPLNSRSLFMQLEKIVK